jgi:hypothetical protein
MKNTLCGYAEWAKILESMGQEITDVNIFKRLFQVVAPKLREYTTISLTNSHKQPVLEDEFWKFIGTFLLYCTAPGTSLSPSRKFEIMVCIADKCGLDIMSKSRFDDIVHHVAAKDPQTKGSPTRKQQTRQLNDLDKLNDLAFQESRKLLDPASAVLVMDDELHGSRAQDVELKTVSDRKAGREGPVHDKLVDSMLSFVYGRRLRKKGESSEANSYELLRLVTNEGLSRRTIPLGGDSYTLVGADRAWGKLKSVVQIGAPEFGRNAAIVIANSNGSRHPFTASSEYDKALKSISKRIREESDPAKRLGIENARNEWCEAIVPFVIDLGQRLSWIRGSSCSTSSAWCRWA